MKAANFVLWVALLVVLLVLAYNWPGRERSVAKPVSGKAGSASSTASVAVQAAPRPKRPVEAQIMVDLLNFRAKKDLRDQAIIMPLRRGTLVKVLKKEAQWLQIELADGRRGFVAYSPRYVRFTKMEAE